MTLSDLLYLFIPATTTIGNILLKLSINQRKQGKLLNFYLAQLIGYSTFIIVVVLSNIFLLDHAASEFVVIFACNYLAVIYSSRWLFRERPSPKEVLYDLLIVVGIILFFMGNELKA